MKRTVILLNPVQTPNYPLNLGYVATYSAADPRVLQAFDLSVLRFNPNDSKACTAVAQEVCDLSPALIGFGQYVWNAHVNLAMARRIHDRRPSTPIVLGGPHVSSVRYAESLLRRVHFVDYVVRGEGEIPFRALLRLLADDPDLVPDRLATIPGLSYRTANRIAHNVPTRVAKLDDIPSPLLWHDQPDWPIGGDGLDLRQYSEALIETNRGCPFRCAFCYWGVGSNAIAMFSEDRISREIDYILSLGVHRLFIADANWGILPRDVAVTRMICEKSVESRARGGLGISRFVVNWNRNVTDRALAMSEALADAQIPSSVTLAYQTLNPTAADLSKRKSVTIEQGRTFLRRAAERNIDVYTDLIWGLPGDDHPDLVNSIDTLVEMGMPHIAVYPLLIIPGTEFYENMEIYGFETIEDGELWRALLESDPGEIDPAVHADGRFSDVLRVVAHPRMTRTSHQNGFATICVTTLLHLVKVADLVNRHLFCRFDIRFSQLLRAADAFFGRTGADALGFERLFRTIQTAIRMAKRTHGATSFSSQMAILLGVHENLEETVRLFHSFYGIVADDSRLDAEERRILHELIRYNVSLAPKLVRDTRLETFHYDFHSYTREILKGWADGHHATPVLAETTCRYVFEASPVDPPEDIFWLGAARRAHVTVVDAMSLGTPAASCAHDGGL